MDGLRSPEILQRLRSAERLVADVASIAGDELAAQRRLRQTHDDDLVRAAFALVDARRRAAVKFPRAEEMWLDRVGTEQATSAAIARHKAARFDGPVCDLCCGIGGDAIALAGRGPVVAVDSDPACCMMTEWNAAIYGVQANVKVRCADAESVDVSQTLVHIDPDRRDEAGRRVRRLERYRPGPEFLTQLTRNCPGGAIKLGPASNFAGWFDSVEYELVSLNGECKEAIAWFGSPAEPGLWRATVLPAGESIAGDPLDALAETTSIGGSIYDPDPAVVRAGLVDAVAIKLGLTRLDGEEEYLTGEDAVASPFVDAFRVEAVLPNNRTELRHWFRSSDVGLVEIKCRRIPIDADAVRRQLPLPGTEPAVLIFARMAGRAKAVVCRR